MVSRSPRRAGFTLVELLVAIGILALLGALIAAGVMGLFGTGYDTKNAVEIRNLDVALQNFHARFKFYPPSQFKVRNVLTNYNMSNQIDRDSLKVLMTMFPRISTTATHAWGPTDNSILDGDQCLVFFLGGAQTTECEGFSTNPTSPTATTADRIGPFYQFPPDRLWKRSNAAFSFLDVYKYCPIAYFRSSNTKYGDNDCGTLVTAKGGGSIPTPRPYKDPATGSYQNKNSYQLISAGADLRFGSGLWSASNPSAAGNDGADDRTNFSSTVLGSGNP